MSMSQMLFEGIPQEVETMPAVLAEYECHVGFFVPGKPATAGSKKGFYHHKLNRVLMVPDNAKARPWSADVKAYAMIALEGRGPVQAEPLFVKTEFVLSRPQGHFGTGRNAHLLKDSAPVWSMSKPDTTKMLRCLEDALTGIVWHDDNQVAVHVASKRYAHLAETPGAHVTVFRIRKTS
jgi:Holliday junction resolvase RusA-like endonuclease